jgi:hypothetical protein
MGCLKITYKNYLTFSKSKKSVCSDYRFGFNGMQKDDEIAGVGNHNTALFWEYDTRLGRRWNVDPKNESFPSLSPFLVVNNNPILLNDVNGDVWPVIAAAAVVEGVMYAATALAAYYMMTHPPDYRPLIRPKFASSSKSCFGSKTKSINSCTRTKKMSN